MLTNMLANKHFIMLACELSSVEGSSFLGRKVKPGGEIGVVSKHWGNVGRSSKSGKCIKRQMLRFADMKKIQQFMLCYVCYSLISGDSPCSAQ